MSLLRLKVLPSLLASGNTSTILQNITQIVRCCSSVIFRFPLFFFGCLMLSPRMFLNCPKISKLDLFPLVLLLLVHSMFMGFPNMSKWFAVFRGCSYLLIVLVGLRCPSLFSFVVCVSPLVFLVLWLAVSRCQGVR